MKISVNVDRIIAHIKDAISFNNWVWAETKVCIGKYKYYHGPSYQIHLVITREKDGFIDGNQSKNKCLTFQEQQP